LQFYGEASEFLKSLKHILKTKAYLFLSAGGIYAELNEGYQAKKLPIQE
jgi:hypothetical protein